MTKSARSKRQSKSVKVSPSIELQDPEDSYTFSSPLGDIPESEQIRLAELSGLLPKGVTTQIHRVRPSEVRSRPAPASTIHGHKPLVDLEYEELVLPELDREPDAADNAGEEMLSMAEEQSLGEEIFDSLTYIIPYSSLFLLLDMSVSSPPERRIIISIHFILPPPLLGRVKCGSELLTIGVPISLFSHFLCPVFFSPLVLLPPTFSFLVSSLFRFPLAIQPRTSSIRSIPRSRRVHHKIYASCS